MSINIHLYVEKRMENDWVLVEQKGTHAWCQPLQNDDLFAFLAGVVNYSGIKPISEAKGLPKDVSPWLKERYESYVFYFSPSYLTVKELMEADWDQEFIPDYDKGPSTIRKECGHFLKYNLPKLQDLAGDDLESVRIVFWFVG